MYHVHVEDIQGNLVTPGINLEFNIEYYNNREREWEMQAS